MKQVIALIALACLVSAYSSVRLKTNMQKMMGHPALEQGYEKGVSACYAGVINGTLIMAGGCNFPDKPVAEGGKKKFYQDIYAAKIEQGDSLQWEKVGELPQAMAYGVSIKYQDTLIFIGGNNETTSLKDVVKLHFENDQPVLDTLPSLPLPIDNMAGTWVGNKIFVVGGNCEGQASKRVWSLDMTNPAQGWQEEPQMPGIARVQPIAFAIDDKTLGIWGGFSPKTEEKAAELGCEGLALSIETGEWTHLPAPTDTTGEIIFAGGSTAINLPNGEALFVGGVNKDIFLAAINQLPQGYLLHEPEWYRFNNQVMYFKGGKWSSILRHQATARAGCALAYHDGWVYIIDGELKPGIRTPEIVRLEVK